MPYAVFEDEETTDPHFSATEQEAWEAAEGAGLVEMTPRREEDARRSSSDSPLRRRSAGKAGDAGSDFHRVVSASRRWESRERSGALLCTAGRPLQPYSRRARFVQKRA